MAQQDRASAVLGLYALGCSADIRGDTPQKRSPTGATCRQCECAGIRKKEAEDLQKCHPTVERKLRSGRSWTFCGKKQPTPTSPSGVRQVRLSVQTAVAEFTGHQTDA